MRKKLQNIEPEQVPFILEGFLCLGVGVLLFFCLKTSRQKENGELEMKKEYYLYVDGHFSETIVDEAIDVENIVETKIMIEAVKNAISMLNTEERDIIECLYFNDETLSSIARRKKVSYQAIQWRKNSILKKLRLLLEEILK